MADIVQSITITAPERLKIPMPHFSDKVLGNHAQQSFDDYRMEIEYVASDSNGYNAVISTMCGLSSQFLASDENPEFTDIPVSLNVNFNVEQPITWNVAYVFPRDMEEYLNDDVDTFGTMVAPFELTSNGIFSINLSLSLGFARFGKNSEMLGLKFDPLSVSASVNAFQELETFDFSDYGIQINPNTLSISLAEVETQNTVPTFRYNITAQVMPL